MNNEMVVLNKAENKALFNIIKKLFAHVDYELGSDKVGVYFFDGCIYMISFSTAIIIASSDITGDYGSRKVKIIDRNTMMLEPIKVYEDGYAKMFRSVDIAIGRALVEITRSHDVEPIGGVFNATSIGLNRKTILGVTKLFSEDYFTLFPGRNYDIITGEVNIKYGNYGNISLESIVLMSKVNRDLSAWGFDYLLQSINKDSNDKSSILSIVNSNARHIANLVYNNDVVVFTPIEYAVALVVAEQLISQKDVIRKKIAYARTAFENFLYGLAIRPILQVSIPDRDKYFMIFCEFIFQRKLSKELLELFLRTYILELIDSGIIKTFIDNSRSFGADGFKYVLDLVFITLNESIESIYKSENIPIVFDLDNIRRFFNYTSYEWQMRSIRGDRDEAMQKIINSISTYLRLIAEKAESDNSER